MYEQLFLFLLHALLATSLSSTSIDELNIKKINGQRGGNEKLDFFGVEILQKLNFSDDDCFCHVKYKLLS